MAIASHGKCKRSVDNIKKERLDTLENVLRDFIIHTEAIQNRTDANINRLEREIDKFRIEMDKFKEEMRADRREMNKQWGALANKMGTLDEDLISPAVRPILVRYFNCDPLIRTY